MAWHKTNEAAAKVIMQTGFVSCATRDEGFYDKGMYFSSNLASIQQAYAPKKHEGLDLEALRLGYLTRGRILTVKCCI